MKKKTKLTPTFNEAKCFAQSDDAIPKCRILTYNRCIGHDRCSSYKTKEQCLNDNNRTLERLQSLPGDIQAHIEEKYSIKIW